MNISQKGKAPVIHLCISAGFTAGVLLLVYLKIPRPMILLERFFPGFGWIEIELGIVGDAAHFDKHGVGRVRVVLDGDDDVDRVVLEVA